ncbi:hypothetical protein HETIRDRAFT_427946 [Heterobasidion irregulare TC 32-1]|uniref:Uncharacterized protein n=1 Tax=Heterobasidion irregulare (strain TC 32-1) TaxID=747525 RepID=W4K5T3_HETIT|nr:uncharacterized protein HETIRDRAFT_427946 [Heterobasidion irregulare TC 32-1]ETW81178.1 hypothetical protein HETIRDRAFT_427946 [Heterobasidion irregulare TC 32-1]
MQEGPKEVSSGSRPAFAAIHNAHMYDCKPRPIQGPSPEEREWCKHAHQLSSPEFPSSMPAACAETMNTSVCAVTDGHPVPAQPISTPPTTYAAAAALPPPPTAKTGLKLLLSVAALSKNSTLDMLEKGEACLPCPPQSVAPRGMPHPIWGSVPVGGLMVRNSGVVMHGAAARGGSIHRGEGGFGWLDEWRMAVQCSRVKVMAEGVPTMVVESTARDVKVLREELQKAVAKNIELEGSLAELRMEMEEMKVRMEDIHSQSKDTREEGGNNARQQNNMLSGHNLAENVQKDGARWNSQAKQDKLVALTIGTIVDSIHVTFSSWVKAYKKYKKPMVDWTLMRQKQWRNTRKMQHAKFRVDVPEAAGPEWAFLQETMY